MTEPDSSFQLVRIEVKLDQALAGNADHETRLRLLESHGTSDHGQRISEVERWRYAVPMAAVAIVASSAAQIIAALVGR